MIRVCTLLICSISEFVLTVITEIVSIVYVTNVNIFISLCNNIIHQSMELLSYTGLTFNVVNFCPFSLDFHQATAEIFVCLFVFWFLFVCLFVFSPFDWLLM